MLNHHFCLHLSLGFCWVQRVQPGDDTRHGTSQHNFTYSVPTRELVSRLLNFLTKASADN